MEEKNDTVTETISLQNDNGCDFNTEFRKTNAPFSVCLCVCFFWGGVGVVRESTLSCPPIPRYWMSHKWYTRRTF